MKAAGQLSPDGKWLSWMAPKDGVLNVWVAPADKPGEARVMTDEKARPVAAYFWSQDSSMILYATDNGGDENYQIYAADVAGGVLIFIGLILTVLKIKPRQMPLNPGA